MKSQNYGYHCPLTREYRYDELASYSPGGRWLNCSPLIGAQKHYRKNRENGLDTDNPERALPLDGECRWVKCPNETVLPREEKVKYGDQGYGWYRTRYDAGPGDQAWMEEKDRNYLTRLLREGQHDELARLGGKATLEKYLGAEMVAKYEHEQEARRERERAEAGDSPFASPDPSMAPTPLTSSQSSAASAGAGSSDLPSLSHSHRASSAAPAPLAAAHLAVPIAGAGREMRGSSPASASSFAVFERLGRVWKGKYADPVYQAHAPKTEGCAVGAIYRKKPSKPGAGHDGRLWLGKVGWRRAERDERTLQTYSLIRRGSSLDSVREKVAADVYGLLAQGRYRVPKHRLAMLPVLNDFTRGNELAQILYRQMNEGRTSPVEEAVHVMSKWMEGYCNLSEAKVKPGEAEAEPFMEYLQREKSLPDHLYWEGQRLPLHGLIEILAASRLLGDTDVLGGGGKNAGFIVERNTAGSYIARAVKIDTGNAFNFEGVDNRFIQSFNPRARASMRMADPKNLQFGNNMPIDIEWARLSDSQRQAFLETFQAGRSLLGMPSLMRMIIDRSGEFNRIEAGLLTDRVVTELIEVWQADLELQVSDDVYGAELRALSVSPSP